MRFGRPYAAAHRHLKAWWQQREDTDKESGLLHLAQATCNMLFLLSMAVRDMPSEYDDRPRYVGQRAQVPKPPVPDVIDPITTPGVVTGWGRSRATGKIEPVIKVDRVEIEKHRPIVDIPHE